MDINIAEQSDASALALIVTSTFHLACPEDSSIELQRIYISKHLSTKRFEQFILSNQHIVLVASDEAEIVGLAVVEKVTETLANLSKLYVLPSSHGKGVALSLFESVLAQVKAIGCEKLELSVYSGNLKAKAFYEKQGFRFVGSCDFHMETEIHDDHVYEKIIR